SGLRRVRDGRGGRGERLDRPGPDHHRDPHRDPPGRRGHDPHLLGRGGRRRPPLISWSELGSGTGPLVFQGVPELRLYLPDGTSRGYQGTIAGVRSGDTTLVTVNTVGIDAYVAGVLPREMPASWPAAA